VHDINDTEIIMAQVILTQPEGLDLSSNENLADRWKNLKQRFELFKEASDLGSKTEKQQTSTFLHVAGDDALKLYNTFTFATADDRWKLAPVMQEFENYCIPKKNITYQRYLFFSRHQYASETIDQYVTDLRSRSQTCEFGDLADSLIRDMIVICIRNNGLRESLLQEPDLSLDTALNKCRSKEQTKHRAKELNKSASASSSSNVDAVNKPRNSNRYKQKVKSQQGQQQKSQRKPQTQQSYDRENNCGRCGKRHKENECKAATVECFQCGKRGHFAKFCRSKKRSQNRSNKVDEVNQSSDESDEEYYVDIHELTKKKKDEWVVKLPVNNTDVSLKLDTGAEVNILPYSVYKKLKTKPKLQKSSVRLRGYSGKIIPVIGKCKAMMKHKSKKQEMSFIIVPNQTRQGLKFRPVLGLKACESLGLIKLVWNVNLEDNMSKDDLSQEMSQESVMDEFSHVFTGLGCLPDTHTIHVDPSVPPVQHACRKIPFKLRDKVKAELQRMESLGVIVKQEEPADWVSNLETVKKKNGIQSFSELENEDAMCCMWPDEGGYL